MLLASLVAHGALMARSWRLGFLLGCGDGEEDEWLGAETAVAVKIALSGVDGDVGLSLEVDAALGAQVARDVDRARCCCQHLITRTNGHPTLGALVARPDRAWPRRAGGPGGGAGRAVDGTVVGHVLGGQLLPAGCTGHARLVVHCVVQLCASPGCRLSTSRAQFFLRKGHRVHLDSSKHR